MPLEIRAAAGGTQEPKPFRAAGGPAAIAAAPDAGAGGEKKLPTFAGVAYTGVPMRPEGWYTPVIIDLAGVRTKQTRPVLRQHDHEQLVGHTTAVTVTARGIEIAGVFSGQAEHVATVTEPAANGFQWQLSVGANPVRTEFLESGEESEINGARWTGPLVISRETELGEISFVPLGADDNTSATVSASKRAKGNSPMFRAMLKAARLNNPVLAAKYSDEDVDKMDEAAAKAALKECMSAADDGKKDDDEEKKKTEAGARIDVAAEFRRLMAAEMEQSVRASREAAAKEIGRQDAIRAAVARHGVTHVEIDGKRVNLEAHAISANWSPERAELEALRAARPAAGTGGPLVYVTNKPELNEAVLEAGVLHALRHSLKLEDDSFYVEPTPDGKGTVRRVPLYLQRQTQGEFRARYTDQVQQGAHSLFKGRVTLKEVLALAAGAAGIPRSQVDLTGEHGVRDFLEAWGARQGIRAEGSSSVSISNVLANVMNKFALQGYLFTEQAWRQVCGVRPVNDFKPTKSINLLGDVQYTKLGPSGELENASLGDQAFANQADPYGRILTIPWTHMVNDDLGILGTVPGKLGQGAGLALNHQVWSLMAAMAAAATVNGVAAPNGDDGNAFWRTSTSDTAATRKAGTAYHANKTTGALTSSTLKTSKALFDNQIDPNGNPLGYEGLKPVLLHPPTLWYDVSNLLQASGIVYGGGSAALQPGGNPWQGYFNPVMSRYIESARYVNSATAYWLLFDPVALAVIEVAFLNGVDTPAVLQAGPDYQFDRLGISIRGTMPFGVNAQNFRGGVYSTGA